MLRLIEPTTDLHDAFQDCRADWGPGRHEDGFGIDDTDDVGTPEGFAAWIALLRGESHPAASPCPDRPHTACRWIVEEGRILGGISLRHHHDELRGRVGYGIRPSARGRGVATWALRTVLAEARAVLGLDHALLICAPDNVASARTIERCGGVLSGRRDTGLGPQLRYRVDLAGAGPR